MNMDKSDNTRQYRTIGEHHQNALLRASATMMVLLCIAAFVCGTAGAATIYVPDDQGTIQQAVNKAITGDTIIVRDGNYNENVDVDKRLTIRSENGSANCIVNASNSGDYVFTITADYVNIIGFAVENATADIIAGIYLHDADNCRVSENNVTGNYNGIHINTSSNNVIADNIVHHNSWWGIWIHLESNNNRVENNTVYNQTDYWNSLGIGIFENSQHNYVYNNTVHDNTISNIELWWDAYYNTVEKNRCYNSEYGILATNDTNHNHIIDNELYENDYGIGIGVINETWGVPSPINNSVYDNRIHDNTKDGIFLDRTDNNSIYNNNCSSNSGHGIHLNCTSNNTLLNNTASGNSDDGIYIWDSSNNVITDNTASGNEEVAGIYLHDADNCRVSENNVTGNYNGIHINTSSNNVIADNIVHHNSWWGIWIHLESNNNRVENNTVYNQTDYWNSLGIGIFENSQHNYVYNNTVHDNTISNIELWWDAYYNTVEKNRCYNSEYGILATNDTNHNHIIDNELYENDYGIGMGVINETWGVPSPINNSVYDNRIHDNTKDGIFLDRTDNNSIYNNNCSSNSGHGIHLNCTSNNTLLNNTASGNSDDGIYIWDSSNNKLTINTAKSNSDSGIHLDNADDNNITCNWVQNNTDAGFYLTSGSTGNKIESNNVIANGEYNDTSDGYEWQFMNNQSDDVSTAGNWWGTNNKTRINASIYDWTYDAGCGNLTTNPRLGGSVPCAPTPEQYAFTTTDAVIALEISVGSHPPDSRYDVSGDGNITSLDALMILQASATGLTMRAGAT